VYTIVYSIEQGRAALYTAHSFPCSDVYSQNPEKLWKKHGCTVDWRMPRIDVDHLLALGEAHQPGSITPAGIADRRS
jgi:hypothetical protein